MKFNVSNILPWISGVIIFLLLFFTFSYFLEKELAELNQKSKEEKQLIASSVAVELEQLIAEKVYLSQSLASYIKFNPSLNNQEFRQFAKGIYKIANKDLVAIQLVRDSIIVFNYPDSADDNLIGRNILEIFEDRELVEQAIEEMKPMLIGPRELLQGKLGMVYRYPIVLDENKDDFWGFSSIVIDINSLFSKALIDSLETYGFYSENKSMLSQGFFYGDSTLKDGEYIEEIITLPSDTWTFRLSIKEDLKLINDFKQRMNLFLIILVVLISGLIIYLTKNIQNIKRLNKELKEKNKKIHAQLDEKVALVREIHHRIKNHFQLISSLNNLMSHEKTDKEILGVIEKINQRISFLSSAYDQLDMGRAQENYMPTYIPTLVNSLLKAVDRSIEFESDIDEVNLYIKRAVYLGVILNEMITNSIKYSFEDTDLPKIYINLKKSGNQLVFKYLDSGKNRIKDIFINYPNSTGLKLIQMFTDQLEGEINQIESNGMHGYKVSFPV